EEQLDDEQHEQDTGEEGRTARVAGAEREPQHYEDRQAGDVPIDGVQPREGVCILERRVDVLCVVVGVDDGENGCVDEVELGKELEHQYRSDDGVGLSEYAHSRSPWPW